MIGKIFTFIVGFIVGTFFGTTLGRWLFEQLINYLQTKGGF